MQNERVFPRLSVRLDAKTRVGGGSAWQSALILNLSAGGALLFTDEEMPALTVLSPLRFSLSESGGEPELPIELEALVLRSVPVEAGEGEAPGFLSGLQFLNLRGEPLEKVRRFVFEGVRDRLRNERTTDTEARS